MAESHEDSGGWARPSGSWVYHFFVGEGSLCGRFVYKGEWMRPPDHILYRCCDECRKAMEGQEDQVP